MDYEKAVELIKKTEAYDNSQRSIKVNLMDFDEKIPLKDYNYKEVASLVTFVDKVEGKQGGYPSAQAQQAEQQREAPTAAQAPVARKPGIMKGFEAAAAELG